MKLNKLFGVYGSNQTRKRVGRGIGSGMGKTCSRGVKGQKSRSGVAIKTEGGQMPLIKRLPKRGFNCSKSKKYVPFSTDKIQSLIEFNKINSNKTIDKPVLVSIGYIKNVQVSVKLVCGKKSIDNKITVKFDSCSKSARSMIEKSGGVIL